MTVNFPRSTNRKPIFDAIRHLLGRGFKQNEVDTLDEAIDALSSREDSAKYTVPSVPSCRISRSVSARGIALIKRFEGCASLRTDGLVEAYPDPATGGEPWTIGWGATGPDLDGSGRIGPDTVWTQAQCDARFERDLARYSDAVSRAIGNAATTQGQFDAMVSFHYNTGAIARATLTKKHVAGDFVGAAAEFARWNRAGGRVLRGLTRRRLEEADLYRS